MHDNLQDRITDLPLSAQACFKHRSTVLRRLRLAKDETRKLFVANNLFMRINGVSTASKGK